MTAHAPSRLPNMHRIGNGVSSGLESVENRWSMDGGMDGRLEE